MTTATAQVGRTASGVVTRQLPKNWVLVVYGIPQAESQLRGELRKILRQHGLWKVDLGGSVYAGVSTPELDKKVGETVELLKKKVGPQRLAKMRQDGMSDLVTFYPGTYEATIAQKFRDGLMENLMGDIQQAEDSIEELEGALVGKVKILGPKDKPRDLLSTGSGRINSAYKLLEGAENLILRFGAAPGLEKDAEKITLRIRQLKTWTDNVKKSYLKWASLERARRAKKETK